MVHFNYLALDAQNREIKGSLEAKDIFEAKMKLRQLGLYITRLQKESHLLEELGLIQIKNLDLAIFSHQFSAMISSGIPLLRSLKALSEETTNKRFRLIIDKIKFDVENGASLSSALLKHPRVFSNFFINLIKSGEAAGILPNVLNRLANHLEKEEDSRRKIALSFAYPAIVSFVAVGVVSFLLIFIVPVFQKVYRTMKLSLPGPTIGLIVLSNIFVRFWWFILLSIGLGFVILGIAKQNTSFGLFFDQSKIRLPLFGQLFRKVAISRFVRTLSTMLGSGLTVSASLTIIKDVVDNRVIGHSIEVIQRDINQGKLLSDSLKEQAIFPPIVVQMIAVGEESGNLIAMLDKCADFLDESIDTLIKNLIVKLEPMLTFLLAAIVGFITLAIYLPMFDLIRHIQD